MSLLTKGGGITALSELLIDIDKNWAGKKISNLGAPAVGTDAKRHDSIPELHSAGRVNADRFPFARMPDMLLNKIMVGQGLGSSPIEEDKPSPGGNAVILVAASDAPQVIKDRADYVCTGANDEATIAALVASGVAIELSEGLFVFNNTLNIAVSHFTLYGQGDATIIGGVCNSDYIKIGDDTNQYTDVTIRDLTIDGTQATGGNAFRIQGGPTPNRNLRIKIQHVSFWDIYSICILFQDVEQSKVCGCIADGGCVGFVYVYLGHHLMITDNTSLHMNDFFVKLSGSNHNTIVGNNIKTCKNFIEISGEANLITGNDFADGQYDGHGIRLIGASNSNTITGNAFKSMRQDAIYDESDGWNVISSNVIVNPGLQTTNTYDAIVLNGCEYDVVAANILYWTGANIARYFINELGGADYNKIFGNQCERTHVGTDILILSGEHTTARDNSGGTAPKTREMIEMKNTSGGALVAGDVVVTKDVAAGDEITTTVGAGDDKIFGMLSEGVADNAKGLVLVLGKTALLKVNGTDNIAIGDFLCTFTDAGIAAKAAAGDMAFAIALEVYEDDDSNGVIDALLIKPRKL